MGMHWDDYIFKFGMPIFYSTMHWEPKHKQLKQIKERQTNNTDHSRDVLLYELILQLLRCTNWLRHDSLEAAALYKAAFPQTSIKVVPSVTKEQVAFLSDTLQECNIRQTNHLLLQSYCDWKDNVKLVRSALMHDFTFKKDDVVMIWGELNEIWFAKIIYLFSYEVNDQILKVCAKVQWYQPIEHIFGDVIQRQVPLVIYQDTMQQYDFIAAYLLPKTDIIDLSSTYRPVKLFPLHTFVAKNPTNIFLIDCCYFVNKMYEIGNNQ